MYRQSKGPTISNKMSNLKGRHELLDRFQSNKSDHKIYKKNVYILNIDYINNNNNNKKKKLDGKTVQAIVNL